MMPNNFEKASVSNIPVVKDHRLCIAQLPRFIDKDLVRKHSGSNNYLLSAPRFRQIDLSIFQSKAGPAG